MRRTRCSLPLAASFMAVAIPGLPGCGQHADDLSAKGNPAGGAARATIEAPSPPIEEKECRKFAHEFLGAIASGNIAAVNALIDWDSIFAKATTDLGVSDSIIAGVTKGMKQSITSTSSFAAALIQSTKSGARFDYLRTKNSHAQQAIVLRMLGAENQGVNYIELFLKRGPDQKIRVVDYYPYFTGELVSQLLRRELMPAVASLSRSFLEKLLRKEHDFVLDMPKIQPISEALIQGRKKEALRLLDELRPGTRKSKMVMLLRTQAAQEAGEKIYLATLEEFRALYPNDPALDLQLIDYYTMVKKPDEVLKCIDRLDQLVGGDPYLNYLRASLAIDRGDRSEARRLAKLVVQQEPTFQDAYYFVIGLSLQDRNHAETLEWLENLHEKLGTTFKSLTTVKEYENFVKSPQYQEWLKYLADEGKRAKAARPSVKQKAEQPSRQPLPVKK